MTTLYSICRGICIYATVRASFRRYEKCIVQNRTTWTAVLSCVHTECGAARDGAARCVVYAAIRRTTEEPCTRPNLHKM